MDEDNSQALVRYALREQEELSLDWFNKLQRLKAGLEHRYKKIVRISEPGSLRLNNLV